MKLSLRLLTVVVLLLGLAGAANAYSINDDYTANGNEFTSSYFATTNDFDTTIPSWTWSGSYAIVSGSDSGKYAAPCGVDGTTEDAKNYVTVPDSTSTSGSGSVMVTDLGGTYNYFGLWWGSMDSYNTLTFYLDGNPTGESFTGDDVVTSGSADGEQTGYRNNHYVNFLNLKSYNGFEMSSTKFAFEADNITVGTVPIPAAVWLFGTGLLGLLGVRRRILK